MISPETSYHKGSILIVDDNPLIVNVVRALLTGEKYEVFTCVNGKEALDLLSTQEVDVILCDVMMPVMDGYQLHTKVRERSEFAHIPFVFLTGLNDSAEVARGQESGADEYLVKPFEPKDLLSVIRGKIQRSAYLKKMSEQRYESFRKKVIHTLSHEFRTPLVAINTGTELLIDQKEKLDQKKVTHLLHAIQRGGRRLERLVNDFMMLQQIEAGIVSRLFETQAKEYFIGDILTLVYNVHLESGEYCEPLVYHHNAGNAKVWVFESHVIEILNRVISNAYKFSPEKKEVELASYLLDQDVVIEVRDRGVGLSQDSIQEALNAFGQLDREKMEQQGGGLGLSIANKLASINRGRIEFEPREGGGTVVSLVLPLYPPAAISSL